MEIKNLNMKPIQVIDGSLSTMVAQFLALSGVNNENNIGEMAKYGQF